MKNPYKTGRFMTVLGATIAATSMNARAVNPEDLPSIAKVKKNDPMRCYWLEAKMTAEGLCGAKLAPDLDLITREASEGNTLAAYRLGQLYTNGTWGVEKDVAQGVEWYTRSAEGGFRHAQIRLGFIYEYGRGVEPDAEKAAYWYEQAAETGIHPDLEDKAVRLRAGPRSE